MVLSLRTIGVTRIFDSGEGGYHKSHAMTSSKIFEKELFEGKRYRKMEDQKLWSGLTLNQDFAKVRGLKPKVKK